MNEQPQVDLPLAIVQPQEQNLPSDAKNKAISDLTAACYQKASQLQLSKEEVTALAADFPDEAFQPGAAGKENLIYIEHAALRERLDQVIGMGQWCMVPIRRWEEAFSYMNYNKEVKGSHVYVDGIMLIRGAFVASAIGEMTYYPDNHTQNYGDAVEGAETAALRRCCKRLGIGLQAWRKDWCLGWWDRKNRKPPVRTQAPPPPTTKTKVEKPPVIGPKYRMTVLNRLKAAPGQENRGLVEDYLRSKLWISGEQCADDFPLNQLPRNAEEFAELTEAVQVFHTQREQVQND